VRPIKLVAQGLTAYHRQVEVDFRELDLFAVTGPTGAGKSSLVDAITYALFGKVPRVGSAVKELISQGDDRLKVELTFAADGGTYRVHRSTARKGQAPVQLERFDEGEQDWVGIADSARETTDEIEQLLRMDYDAFIRSVLLPQGEFQQFLAGDRDERRKVLDGLLRIGVFTIMGQKANALFAKHRDEADGFRKRLDEELADATPDKLREAKADLESLRVEAAEATALCKQIAEATTTAQRLAEAVGHETKALTSLAEAAAKLKDAQTVAATGKDQEAAHRRTVETLGKQLAANVYDEPAFVRYQLAAQRAVDLATEEAEAATREKEGEALGKDAAAAKADAEKAQKAYETAHGEAEHAQHLYQEARMTNAAAVLQRELKPGDPCPVCGGKVGKVTPVTVAEFEKARVAADKAKDVEGKARTAMDAANSRRDQAVARAEAHANTLSEATARIETRRKALSEALAGEVLTAAQIATKLETLEKAREERDELRSKIEAETEKLNALLARTLEAAGSLKLWQAEVERCDAEAKAARVQIEALGTTLREAALAAEWEDVARAVDASTDTEPLLRKRLDAAQLQERAALQAIGSCEQRIKQIDKDIKQAKELTKREKEARETASLAADLASLLKTTNFPTFIRERALKTLAVAGSERLREISGGRYELVVDGQDFEIEDKWNGSERRSVKTLSGGETFLASLALALALAEHLPGLGSRGEVGALESLFIDEGFSNLDNETLDVVAGALEVLGQDRRRLIGVITHVQALAERMPARIVVHKLQAGSTVSVE
jgi:exonuclease SbcC